MAAVAIHFVGSDKPVLIDIPGDANGLRTLAPKRLDKGRIDYVGDKATGQSPIMAPTSSVAYFEIIEDVPMIEAQIL